MTALKPRMSYDEDGTALVKYNAYDDLLAAIPRLDIVKLNSESNTESITLNSPGVLSSEYYIGFIFPETRYVDGIFISVIDALPSINFTLEYSQNTTNFFDGDWYTATTITPSVNTKPNYANSDPVISVIEAKAIRLVNRSGSSNLAKIKNIHIYGSKIETSQRLEFWHPTLDEPLDRNYLNGTAIVGSSFLKSFRIKNMSPSLKASNIQLQIEALTDTFPANKLEYTLSYQTTSSPGYYISIPEIAANDVSDIVYLNRTTPENAILGYWSVRVFAECIDGWL